MGLVNFYPMIGGEEGLPVYVRGIGVGHEQEKKRFVTPNDSIHLHITVSGCGIVTCDGKRKMLPVGTMMLTPPGTLLDIAPAPSGWTDNWIGIIARDNIITRFGGGIRVFTPGDTGAVNQLYDDIGRELTVHTLRGRLLAAGDAYKLLMYALSDIDASSGISIADSRLVSTAAGFVEQHFREHIDLSMLCAACGNVSRQYFCRVFRERTGMRPVEYILHKRIEYAKQLLAHTDLEVREVAENSGFESESYFFRCWKRTEKETPAEYRRGHKGIFV